MLPSLDSLSLSLPLILPLLQLPLILLALHLPQTLAILQISPSASAGFSLAIVTVTPSSRVSLRRDLPYRPNTYLA